MEPRDPILNIRLRKGLADRHRLPLRAVQTVLEHCRLLINDLAKRDGNDAPLDLQLELLGAPGGALFAGGSVQMQIVAGAHPAIAAAAMQSAILSLQKLEQRDNSFTLNNPSGARAVEHFHRIGIEQTKTGSELELSWLGLDATKLQASLTPVALETVRALQNPNSELCGARAYGKLMELREVHEADDHGRGFQGQLLLDNGDEWRVKFREDQQHLAASLFRKRVVVSGTVKYFQTRAPKITAESIHLDPPRDYLAAFEKFVGTAPELKGQSLEQLMQAVRGED